MEEQIRLTIILEQFRELERINYDKYLEIRRKVEDIKYNK